MDSKHKIVQLSNGVLRKQAQPVEKIDENVKEIIQEMENILKSSEDAAALAAPQIGISKQIVVIKKFQTDNFNIPEMVLINPEIIEKKSLEQEAEEGCLSLMEPEIRGVVSRAGQIKVKALDEKGREFEKTAYGLLARIIQHEVDHLRGKLFVDRAQPNTIYQVNNQSNKDEQGPKI